jgi:Co/Zn/Cd efflux system component
MAAIDNDLSSLSGEPRRKLWIVIGISLGLFVFEMAAGALANSQALKADALDFLLYGSAYALALWSAGQPPKLAAGVALGRAAAQFVLGIVIAVTTLYHFLTRAMPDVDLMVWFGILALGGNALAVYLMTPHRDAPPLARVYLASRNDTLGNLAVLIAALLVAALGAGSPDLIVAGVMVALFLATAWSDLRRSWSAWQEVTREPEPVRPTAPEIPPPPAESEQP